MKFLLVMLIILIVSCDDPLSKKEMERSYTREFSNKDKSKLSTYSRQWLFKNLEKVQFEDLQDQTVIAGNAEDFNFDSDNSKLFFKFYLKAENNKYTLSLKADSKEVQKYNHENGNNYTESEEIKESDKDDVHKLFNDIDRQLYNYILIVDQGGSL